MHLLERAKRALLRQLLPPAIEARHAEYSMIASADDETGRPSPGLIRLAVEAITRARHYDLKEISARMGEPPYFPEIWPGEGYKLLAGLVAARTPKTIVEIGTGGGTSTLALLRELPPGGQLVSFDIIKWDDYPGHLLRPRDFDGGQLVQHVEDISQPERFDAHRALLESADVLYIDAAKDGVMEQRLLDRFATLRFRAPPLLIFDDIRVWNMLKIWRAIRHPKLDVSSFGHWTGTGLVEWTASTREATR